jgi:DNA mismatch repair ATPase MutS
VAAVERDWVEPLLVHEPVLYIEGGRHPLCELCVDTFVSFWHFVQRTHNNRTGVRVYHGPTS